MDPSVYEAARSGDLGFLKKIGDGDLSINLLLQKTPKNNNILHLAAEFKQIDFFKGIPIDNQSPLFWDTNNKGDTPMHVAAKAGCDEVVGLLINHARMLHTDGADEENALAGGKAYKDLLRIKNLIEDTGLHVAVKYGHLKVVILLVEADPELCSFTNSANESSLFLAISKGFPNIARYMLDKYPTFTSFQGINGVTALHAAVTHKIKCKGIVEMMVSSHPEIIKETDANGWTLLHYAALRGNVKATRLLMQQDSSISYILDKSGMSALHVAAYAGRQKVMEVLTQFRPDTCELVNHKGQTVLHAAVLGGQYFTVKYILRTPKFAGLINEADNDGNTPLHLAAIQRDTSVLRPLARNPRVDKTAINNQLLKAADVYLGDDIEFDLKLLGRHVGVTIFQQQIRRDFMKLESPENDTPKSTLIIAEKRAQEAHWDDSSKFDTNLVVAMLIATVTFAAAFTLPGGFKSNGMPVLYKRAFFQVFVVFDVISFFLSTFVVFNHFMLVTHSLTQATPETPPILIQYSIGGMMVAFSSGMLVVLPKYSPLGVLIILACCIACYVVIARLRVFALPTKRQIEIRGWLRSRKI
ncbi:ankyrin repeat-containing protein [Pyrus ussuriensis x Pyrus communis]|uniref:Ankyrin repeat-containing protein n=1 Tax=Pyrus ussuriensis x Pyrus communis TaxID=2448454 RepID=A0A5N5HMA0_9ROSA|nr:ankyrin repeat-containing protein [Pyrus ussuriensis x Pyrus communis]